MKTKAKGNQLDTLPKSPEDLEQISFNLNKQDQFIQSHGITFEHYRAVPSPIGLKDRGEYRRSDQLDTISSNGYIYMKCGEFEAVLMGNNKSHTNIDAGFYDESLARLTLPRFYNNGEEILLAVGDRVYIKDLEVKVVTYEKINHNLNGVDLLRYPALCVEFLIDADGQSYTLGIDYKIVKGNIHWIGKNPGIDQDTGEGRVYSIRYQYNAHWYINKLINEIRIGKTTDGDVRSPSRMPYHVLVQREYVYHNKMNDGTNERQPENRTEPSRVVESPTEPVLPKQKARLNKRTFKLNEE